AKPTMLLRLRHTTLLISPLTFDASSFLLHQRSQVCSASNPRCRRPRLDARRLRRNALLPRGRPHHPRPANEQTDRRTAEHTDLARLRHWRRSLRLHRRSHWTQTRAYAEHPHLLDLLVCLRLGDFSLNSCLPAVPARPGNGRRVEYRSDARRRNLANSSSPPRSRVSPN